MAHAFERLVVEVEVGQFDFVGVDGVGIDGEVVIVGGDLDLAGGVIAGPVLPPWWPNLSL